MPRSVHVLNGSNPDCPGTREPSIPGSDTLANARVLP